MVQHTFTSCQGLWLLLKALRLLGVRHWVSFFWLELQHNFLGFLSFLDFLALDRGEFIELQSKISFLVSVVSDGCIKIEDISLMPFSVKLLLDQLDNFLLFCFDSSLLLPESIELRLLLCYFLAISVHVLKATVWIFIPNV